MTLSRYARLYGLPFGGRNLMAGIISSPVLVFTWCRNPSPDSTKIGRTANGLLPRCGAAGAPGAPEAGAPGAAGAGAAPAACPPEAAGIPGPASSAGGAPRAPPAG